MNDATSRERFYDLLIRFSQEQSAENRKQIELQIWETYGASISTLVVDMSGFTSLTESHGVVHFLSMVRRMQLTAQPIIQSYGGTVVKFEADNAFACFDLPGNAIRAAIALNLALASANILTSEELDIHISCGIDHGRCLLPHETDFYGGPVNRASKLGEDLGEPGQILVSEEAISLVPQSLGINTKPVEVEIAGKAVLVHSVLYRKGQ